MNISKRLILFSIYFLLSTVTPSFSQFNFTCSNGETIPIMQFCNDRSNCDDGSDEIISTSNCSDCNPSMTSCTRGPRSCLIDTEYICNMSISCSGSNPCDVGCPGFYECADGDCKMRSTLCDGDSCNGCPEDDGWTSGVGFLCFRNGDLCKIPQQLLWDEIQDCDQGEDLCFISRNASVNQTTNRDIRGLPGTTFDTSRCFSCLDDSMIVPRHKVCDDVIDCSDLSDECLCQGKEVPEICGYISWRSQMLTTPGLASCNVGQIDCENGSCINRTSVCDAISDCTDNRDERFESCGATLFCDDGSTRNEGQQCRCKTRCENNLGVLCDGVGDCPPNDPIQTWADPPGYPDDECRTQCSNQPRFNCTSRQLITNTPVVFEPVMCERITSPNPGSPSQPNQNIKNVTVGPDDVCDGVIHCSFTQEDEANCTERFECLNEDKISISTSSVCDGTVTCDGGEDEDPDSCPDRFFCPSLNGVKVSIKSSSVCDFIINCDNGEDEMNCTEDGRFYCESGMPLFVRERQIFDGRFDCDDSSDECPTSEDNRNEDTFSSRYHLIANPILRGLVWVMGVLGLTGNLIVIISESKLLYHLKGKSRSASTRTSHALILNLALADFMMGVYLLMLGIVGVVYSDVFCIYELIWRSSFTCQFMGSLVVISSETSVITMVFLATFRLFAVLKPFSASGKPSGKTLILLVSTSWVIALLLASMPFLTPLQHLFVDKAIVPNNPFFPNVVIDFDSAKNWAEKLVTFDPSLMNSTQDQIYNIRDASSWEALQSSLGYSRQANLLDVTGYIGYYSSSTVCIPRLFVTRSDKAWRFTLTLAIINFLAFIYVATLYCVIIIKARRNSRKMQKTLAHHTKRQQRGGAVQRKIYRLVATDFCCWVPISLMVFINFSGIPVGDISYVISAIVLLPINSALNPILYSNAIDTLIKKLRHSKRRLTRTKPKNNHPQCDNGGREVDPPTLTTDCRL